MLTFLVVGAQCNEYLEQGKILLARFTLFNFIQISRSGLA